MSNTPTLPTWWNVMAPHRDIRSNRRLDESIFAADLGQVVRGQAPHDYQDPLRFFAGTYLSEGLRSLMSDVLRELGGIGTGNRIIQIETPFGGGKTHTLLALYHLMTDRETVIKRSEVAQLVRDAGLSSIPETRITTLVGTDPKADELISADGKRFNTLWGLLAWELGGAAGYERVRRADEGMVAPGADALRGLLAEGPAKLILMDELVVYVVGAAGVKTGGGSTLKDQTISFLQQLTQAVAQTARCILLLTIPGSNTELYGQSAKDLQQDVFAAAGQLSDVVGRIQTVRTPVQGDDIYEVLRRRLLESPADDAARIARDTKARAVANAYVEMYRELRHDVPQEVQEPAYVERMVRAYPFHPDIVKIFYERWGTLPNFQRTRGALRILAMTLADLLANNSHDPLILPSHINLAPGDLRNELVRIVENTAFNNVLDSDIAGANAKATQVDAGLGREHARLHPAERVASTIFLWSFSGAMGTTRGANEAQIRVGILTPDMQPAIIGNVLNDFRRRLWYLHEENGTYRFDTQANLNRVIVQKEESVTAQAARKAVEDKLSELANERKRTGSGPMFAGASAPDDARPYLFPKDSQDVADITSIGIVLLRPSMHAPSGTSLDTLPPIVDDIMHRYGPRPRQHRNALVVLVPDTELVAGAERAATRLLALQAAASDTQLALPDHQRKELANQLQVSRDAFPQEVGRIYRSVVIPASQDKRGMERFDLGLRPFSKNGTLWDEAFSLLSTEDRYLQSLSPTLLASDHFGIWAKGADWVSTQKAWDAFIQFPHLPMLASKKVLLRTIEQGCDQGLFGYAIRDEQDGPFNADQHRFGNEGKSLQVEITPITWVVSADYARKNFIDRRDPVREIDPEVLTHPSIWPQGSNRRSLSDVWAAVVNHYAPQPIDGPYVFEAVLHAGYHQNLFRVARVGQEPVSDISTLSLGDEQSFRSFELVRPQRVGPEIKRFLTIDVPNVDPGQLSKIVTGVISPLRSQGATIKLRLVIDADAPGGIAPEVLELTIKETFKQLGLTPEYE
jgi:hypothetical protein